MVYWGNHGLPNYPFSPLKKGFRTFPGHQHEALLSFTTNWSLVENEDFLYTWPWDCLNILKYFISSDRWGIEGLWLSSNLSSVLPDVLEPPAIAQPPISECKLERFSPLRRRRPWGQCGRGGSLRTHTMSLTALPYACSGSQGSWVPPEPLLTYRTSWFIKLELLWVSRTLSQSHWFGVGGCGLSWWGRWVGFCGHENSFILPATNQLAFKQA